MNHQLTAIYYVHTAQILPEDHLGLNKGIPAAAWHQLRGSVQYVEHMSFVKKGLVVFRQYIASGSAHGVSSKQVSVYAHLNLIGPVSTSGAVHLTTTEVLVLLLM